MLAFFQHPDRRAIAWFLLSCIAGSCMVTIVRHISAELSTAQIVFLRNAIALLLLLPWVLHRGVASIRTTKLKMYTLRALNSMLSMFSMFYGLSMIPLTDATALSFTTPIFTTLVAMLVLKESVGKHRWIAIFIGFAGVLIILRPGMQALNAGYAASLAAAFLVANSLIIIKQLSKTESPLDVVFYMTLLMTPLSLPFAIPSWQWPSLETWGWFVILGILANTAQITLSKACSLTAMTTLMPFDFSRLIFIALIAYIGFGETMDVWTFIGAGVIVGSAIYITHREAKLKKLRPDAAVIDRAGS